MKYPEWGDLEIVIDENNPFSTLFRYPSGEMFYIEGSFYTQLTNLKNIYQSQFNDILDEMKKIIFENKKVVFTMDFENPVTHVDDFIYQEITDITDRLGIYIEDKSRGSDYGD